MIAVIVNAGYKTAASVHQAERIFEELKKLGEDARIIDNGVHILSEKPQYKKAVYLDKDIYCALLLEKNGVRLYNTAAAIELADDKAKTLIALKNLNSLKIPKTVFPPKVYKGSCGGEVFEELESILNYPIIVKENTGSLGEQVYLAGGREELIDIVNKIGGRAHFFQEFVDKSYGKSIRIYAVTDKVLGAIRLTNPSGFRSNAAAGGKAEKITVSQAHEQAALDVMRVMGLDFAGIDFFDTAEPVLIEVNSNAYFLSFEKTGVNVAAEIARHILR